MNTRILLEKRAYIVRMGQDLSDMFSRAQYSSHKINFHRTIRAMSFWGSYPWKSFNYQPKQVKGFGFLILLLSLPLRTFEGVLYFAVKYLEYYPFRRFRKVDFASRKLAVFSPSLHLLEFTDRTYTGFWGEVKFLNDSVAANTAWFLVPFKSKGISNRQTAREISRIHQETDFLLIPLAAFYSLKVMSRAIVEFVTFHRFIAKVLLVEAIGHHKNGFSWAFDAQSLGIGLSRTELNRHLISASLARENQIKNCLHLMEGQSWEIALNDVAGTSQFNCWGVIHTPLRSQDSQILNYLLAIDEKNLAERVQGICCPGRSTIQSLEALGISSSQFRLIEAQRFNHYQATLNFKYSRDSRRVLYVSDANIETTELFAELIAEKSSNNALPQVQFLLKAHPSQTHLGFTQMPGWDISESAEFGLIIFGPETSSYLQPEFSASNIRIFKSNAMAFSPHLADEIRIPFIETLENLEDFIENPFTLVISDESIIARDLNFKKWRKLIDELLES